MQEVLYSKKYPTPQEIIEEMEEKNLIMETESNSSEEKDTFLQNLFTKMEYRPIAGKDKVTAVFVEQAKKLSSIYEIDIEISKQESCVRVKLGCYEALISSYLKEDISKLLYICDDFTIWTNAKISQGYDYIWDFSLNTHDTYVNGKKIGI